MAEKWSRRLSNIWPDYKWTVIARKKRYVFILERQSRQIELAYPKDFLEVMVILEGAQKTIYDIGKLLVDAYKAKEK